MSHLVPFGRAAVAGLAAVLLSGAVAAAASPAPSPFPGPVFQYDQAAAEAQCTAAGGTVQERRAAFNTNMDPSGWLMLAGDTELCRFQTMGGDDTSRIYVDLRTLSSEVPTLAATAYLADIPMNVKTTGGANPATAYCASLDGTSAFGPTGSGGGWVNLDDPIDLVLAMCVFADGSMIDEWGIAYHSNGTIRGIDLATVLAWQPGDTLPPVYG
jgi:putative hemolysin